MGPQERAGYAEYGQQLPRPNAQKTVKSAGKHGPLPDSSSAEELKGFLTKSKDGALPGPGDALMGFLGVVVLTFGFQIFSQRALLRRHAAEVLGCAILASLASMAFTCVAGRALGLPADLSLAIAPRSVTVALAMPIAEQLGTPEHLIAITASAVLVTGLVGAMGVHRRRRAAQT